MKPRPWTTDDHDFPSCRIRSHGLPDRRATCIIALTAIVYPALSLMVAQWNRVVARPPAQPIHARIANPSTASPSARQRDRVDWDRRLDDDRFVTAAPTEIDEAIIVAAQETIDARIIFNPYPTEASRRAAVILVPRASVQKPTEPNRR